MLIFYSLSAGAVNSNSSNFNSSTSSSIIAHRQISSSADENNTAQQQQRAVFQSTRCFVKTLLPGTWYLIICDASCISIYTQYHNSRGRHCFSLSYCSHYCDVGSRHLGCTGCTLKILHLINSSSPGFCLYCSCICNVFQLYPTWRQSLESTRRYLAQISNVLVTFNSAINFLIYCVFSRNFRTVLIRRFHTIYSRMRAESKDNVGGSKCCCVGGANSEKRRRQSTTTG